MSLGDATLFAIPPDGGVDPTITRTYLTDAIRSRSGTEKRAALRSSPLRSITYTALFGNQDEASDFRLAWLAATERLRFIVPLWPEYAVPTAFPTSATIAGDFTNRDFAPFTQVLVWQDRTHFEAATILTLADSLLTLTAPLVGSYTPLAARILPLMPAWLDVPTVTLLETAIETVPLTFHEEVQGAAGVDSEAGLAAAMTCTSVTVEETYRGSAGLKVFYGWRVHAFDAAGFEIPNPTVAWTVTPDSGVTAVPVFTTTADGREAGMRWVGDADQHFTMTVTVGAITVTFSAHD